MDLWNLVCCKVVFGSVGGYDFFGEGFYIFLGFWGYVWVEVSFFEDVFVVVEDWGWGVEGYGEYVVLGVGVIIDDGWEIGFGVELGVCIFY